MSNVDRKRTGMPISRRYRAGQNKRPRIVTPYMPQQLSQGEWKYRDYNIALAMDTTYPALLLDGITPGTRAFERIGNRVTIKSLELRINVGTTTAVASSQFCRWIVVLDRQSNASTPTLANILNPGTYFGVRNLDNRRRFKIIMDNQFTIGVSSTDTNKREWHVYMKFRKPLIVDYNGGGSGGISDIASNALWLVSIGTNVPGVNAAAMDGTSRIRYLDM